MIFEEEIYPEDFQKKLEAFEEIQKAFDSESISSVTYGLAFEALEKAKKDLSKLTKKKVFAKRKDGHIYMTTVYVNEQGKIKEDLEAKFVLTPIGTPETMMGDMVRITKKNGEVFEGPVVYVHAWKDKKTGEPNADIHVEVDGKVKKTIVGQISKFEKFNSTGESQKPQGEVDKFGYTVIKKLGGSTGAVLVEKDGVKYVKKTAANPEHLSSEMRSLNYMSQIGVPVPKVMDYYKGEAAYMEYIEGQTLKDYLKDSSTKSSEIESVYAKISQHFAANALFANHDAIGLDFDNVMVSKDYAGYPQVHFVDVGGSMGYRAMGGLKESWHTWNENCGLDELKSMLDLKMNKQSAAVFTTGLVTIKNLNKQLDEKDVSIEDLIYDQLMTIKNSSPKWYESPATPDANILKKRLDAALKLFTKEESIEASVENKIKNLNFDEQLRYENFKNLYKFEKETALKHNRSDVAEFYDDFVDYMFMTDKDIQEANSKLSDPNSYYSSNDEEFISECPSLTKANLYAIRKHTDSSTPMNNVLRDLCNGLSDGYNISFKDKTKKVSFNKEEFKKKLESGSNNLTFARMILDTFSKMKNSNSEYFRKDATLYRGISSNENSRRTLGSEGNNIYCDAGVSSNGQSYNKAFDNPLIIATTMAEGVDVHTVGSHPGERETIMKPFNMQQVTLFVDSIEEVGHESAKGRYQVRVEKPGLIPIKFS